MAIIKGLWFLNDSLITWEGLPIGYKNEININGRVWKNGVWQPFVSLRVTEHSEYSYLFKNDMVFTSGDGEYINIIDNGYKWWTGFTRDRVIDFGEEPQEMDDTIYNFITTNATQVEFNDVFMILNGNFKWKEVLQDGTNFNHDYIYVNGNFTEPEGEMFECFMFAIVTEELASALGLTPGVWGLGRGIMNTNTGEQSVTGFYQNGVWSSEEARSFTLDNQTLSKTLALYILENTEPRVSKGPNYTALKNALDRLAAAIKDNIGGEAIYPFTIEEMCNIADGTMPVANEGEKGKEGFFYYMEKMADCIAQRCDVELPLTIEEMIEALGRTNSVNITLKAADGGLSKHTSMAVKFGSLSEDGIVYTCNSGSTVIITADYGDFYYDPIQLSVESVAYIWQSKIDSKAGYQLNDGPLISVGVGKENATRVKLKEGDILTLISTGLD